LLITGRWHQARFKRSVIFLFDRDAFDESDFISSAITDPLEDDLMKFLGAQMRQQMMTTKTRKKKPEPELGPVKESNETKKVFVSPEQFRGFPKAWKRKDATKRKKSGSMIVTDSLEKIVIGEREQSKKQVSNEAVVKAKKKF
jgi:hypothetical protein